LMYLIKQECNKFNYRCRKYIDDKVFLRYGRKFIIIEIFPKHHSWWI